MGNIDVSPCFDFRFIGLNSLFRGEEPFQEYSDLPTFQRDVHWQGKRLPFPDTWPEDVDFLSTIFFFLFGNAAEKAYFTHVGCQS